MSSPFAAPAAINSPGAILDPNTKGAPDERNIGPLVAMTPGPLGLLALAKAVPFRRYLPKTSSSQPSNMIGCFAPRYNLIENGNGLIVALDHNGWHNRLVLLNADGQNLRPGNHVVERDRRSFVHRGLA